MRFIFFLFVVISFHANSQTLVKGLKKKSFGNYKGVIESYHYIADTVTIQVEASPIEISLDKKFISITVGKITKRGSYVVLFKGSDYYLIDAFFEGDVLTERIVVNDKKKTLLREGIHPQPNTTLSKTKGR